MSVIIPCYRAHDTLARAVASVAAQTVRPFEVLIVDDASGDATPGVLRQLQLRYGAEWLRIVEQDVNRGPAASRNVGWRIARGEMIAFLDADDTWHPQKVEIQFGFMREHPEFAISAHAHSFGSQASPVSQRPSWRPVTFDTLLWSNRFVTPSVMLRNTVEERFRSEQRFMEDHLLWLEVAAVGHRIAFIDAPLANLYKAQFGESGASAKLLAMERASLGNYARLYRTGRIRLGLTVTLWAWSLLKFVRRLLVVACRRYLQMNPARRSAP